jgi:subtilisin family serine protease
MNSLVPQPRHRFHPAVVLVAVLALAGLASCGRQLPTASLFAPGTARVAGAARSGGDPEDVVVLLGPGTNAQEVAASYGASVLLEEAGLARLLPAPGETPAQLVTRLSADPRLMTSESNASLQPAEMRGQEPFASDDGQGNPETWAHQPAAEALHLAEAHQSSSGANVRVAILDTGIDPAHPAFAGRIVGTWDFISGDADASEQPDGLDNDGDGLVDEAVGHGTHVAGVVSLTAPRCELLIARVLDSDGRGDVMSVASGVRWAIDHGARVINLSLGMLKNSDALQHVLAEAEARGIVVVAAAGNWGAENPREFPGSSSHAFAIAAVNADATPATFTSFGSQVALCAPGVAIRSTFVGGGYRVWSGTSMAAPFVAGTAALLFALHPNWDPEAILQRITTTTVPAVAVPPAMQGRLGAGVLDVGAALAADRVDGDIVNPGSDTPVDIRTRR